MPRYEPYRTFEAVARNDAGRGKKINVVVKDMGEPMDEITKAQWKEIVRRLEEMAGTGWSVDEEDLDEVLG